MEQELFDILSKFHGLNADMLYNQLILLDIESEYDKDEYTKFALLFSLFLIGRLNKKELINLYNKYKALPLEKTNKLTQDIIDGYPDWIGFSKQEDTKGNIFKIYLSIDNSSIHLFINEFIKTCLDKEYDDYDFKINNKERTNRRDNVVIYCNENNFGRYIRTVEDVLEKNPNIKFNSSHLLGIKYSEKIYCGIDPDENISYTDKICQAIFMALRNNDQVEDIVAKLTLKRLKQEPAIHVLAEQKTLK